MKFKVKDITLIGLMTAILAVCSQISIPIGPVPISLQTLAVGLIGTLLMPIHAFIATALYLVLGLIGLPIFAGGSGGFEGVISPSFGFIIAFMIASPVMSMVINKEKYPNLKRYIIAHIILNLILYPIGLAYMAFVLNGLNAMNLPFMEIMVIGFIPFIPGDLIKTVLAIIIGKRVRKISSYQSYYQANAYVK